jgi:2-iminobutanoate/2-iminopropanoate deaminase
LRIVEPERPDSQHWRPEPQASGNPPIVETRKGVVDGLGVRFGLDALIKGDLISLRAVLEDAGSSLERIIKVTCYVADPNAFPTLNALFAEFFPVAPPVRSTPLVQLPRGLLFSIDAIAVVP